MIKSLLLLPILMSFFFISYMGQKKTDQISIDQVKGSKLDKVVTEYGLNYEDVGNKISKEYQNSMSWVGDWIPSDNAGSAYGKGRFYYRLARSNYGDSYGNYIYEIYFISDSYYNAGMYNGNPYRSATKIDEMRLYVNGQPHINRVTNSHAFWVMFQGNFDQGAGEMRISFHYPSPNAQIYITWSMPKPF